MGCGRTGTMLACYLVSKEGYSAEEAIAEVRRRRRYSIETRTQEKAVLEFERSLKGTSKWASKWGTSLETLYIPIQSEYIFIYRHNRLCKEIIESDDEYITKLIFCVCLMYTYTQCYSSYMYFKWLNWEDWSWTNHCFAVMQWINNTITHKGHASRQSAECSHFP